MSRFRDCIMTEFQEGRIGAQRAEEAAELYDELAAEFRGRMNDDAAAAAARAETIKVLAMQAAERRRYQALQGKRAAELERRIQAAADPSDALRGLISRLHAGQGRTVEGQNDAILGLLLRRHDEFVRKHSRDLIGRSRNQDDQFDILREVFGEDTGNPYAKAQAKAWGETAEEARRMFNAEGGQIPKRADWGLPQSHDMLKIRKASYPEWRDFILPRLDRSRMIDYNTGLPMSPQKLEALLPQIYDDLRTDGWASRTPSAVPAGRAIGRRRTDHRFFAFKDAASWKQYQDRFGEGDVFDVMMGHVSMMARDIAAMRVLGPNPNATLTYIKQVAMKRAMTFDAATGGDRMERRVTAGSHHLDMMWSNYTAALNKPSGTVFANWAASARNILVAAKLGGAMLSAVSDLGLQRATLKFNGLSHTRFMGQLLRQLNPADDADRRLASRLGVVAEELIGTSAAQQRYVGEALGHNWTRIAADSVLRVSLLSPWTAGGRRAMQLTIMGELADQVGKTFAQMPKPMADMLKRYGIGEGRWLRISKAHVVDHKGAEFLDAASLMTVDDDLATRVLEMARTETEFAVPSHAIAAKAILNQTKRGTAGGELLRSAAMFKSFSVIMLYTHARRAMAQTSGLNRAAYAANLIVSTTLMGALAVQLKEIAKGRDPRPMDDQRFWGAAMAQGGGLGIYGDFLFSDLARNDRNLAETAVGAGFGLVTDFAGLTVGNAQGFIEGRDTNAGRELVRFVRDYTPGGTLWYARLALDRTIFDQLEKWADPNYERRMRQRINKVRKEFGTDFYWRPGEIAPDRAPDFGNAMEASP